MCHRRALWGATAALYENANGWKKYSIVEVPYSFIDNNGYQYLKTSSNSVSLIGKSVVGNEVVVRNAIIDYSSDRYYVTSIGDKAFKSTGVKKLDTSNALKLKSLWRRVLCAVPATEKCCFNRRHLGDGREGVCRLHFVARCYVAVDLARFASDGILWLLGSERGELAAWRVDNRRGYFW